jgi:hypothetical protein
MLRPPPPILQRLQALPQGYGEGEFEGRRYGVTVNASADGRRWWVWAEDLGGADRVSANVYVLGDGRVLLKPCEMETSKVEDFLEGFRPGAGGRG